jgi:hypothetical protein
VREAVFRPTPVQAPRIPVRVGGKWTVAGPIRRAARWDGFVPEEDVTPDEVRKIRSLVEERRGSLDGYDIVLGGSRCGEEWEAEPRTIAGVAEAGATWRIEYVPSLPAEEMSARIRAGPLRVD